MSETQPIPLIRVTCYKCGTKFALNAVAYQELHHSHDEFWCPRGHKQYFPRERKEAVKP